MTDMAGEDDNVGKTSKRDRLRGALARTKSKFKKHDGRGDEAGDISDEVKEFLSAGQTPTATQPSTGVAATLDQQSPRPSTSDSSFSIHSRSSRKIVVPRIDVTNSQRWPGAQPLHLHQSQHPNQNQSQDLTDFLRPEYHTRSQSASSLSSKRKERARGLSVTFIEAPPVIIGEGGDDAQKPPVEISRARARTVSPVPSPSHSRNHSVSDSPQPPNGVCGAGRRPRPPEALLPRRLQRAQTGFTPGGPASALDKEFEMTLRGGSGANSPDRETAPSPTQILAPRPVRPVHPPVVMEILEPHVVKKEASVGDLRQQFREGDALKRHHNVDDADDHDRVSGAPSQNGSLELNQQRR